MQQSRQTFDRHPDTLSQMCLYDVCYMPAMCRHMVLDGDFRMVFVCRTMPETSFMVLLSECSIQSFEF